MSDEKHSWMEDLSRKSRVMRDMVPRAGKERARVPPPSAAEEAERSPFSFGRESAETRAENFFRGGAVAVLNSPQPKRKDKEGKAETVLPLNVKRWQPARSRVIWFWGGGAVGAVLGILILLSTVFAKVYISVQPAVLEKNLAPTAVTVTPDAHAIDPAKKIIPGALIELSESREVTREASGRKVVSERARGTITIFNTYSSQPQVLVLSTRFSAPDGKIFKLAKAVTVPGAKVQNGTILPSSVEVEVTAEKPGEAYNLGPSEFRIPGFQGTPRYAGFSARSSVPFEGGFEGDASVVTEADLDAASEAATKEVYRYLKELLAKRVPEGFRVIDGGHEIDITDVSGPAIGSRATQFKTKATARVRGIAFRENDERDFIAAFFSEAIPFSVVPEKSDIERRSVSLDLAKRRLSFVLSGNVGLESRLDENAIRQDALGRSSSELAEMLGAKGRVGAYRITFFPPWIKKAPGSPSDIKIKMGQVVVDE